MKRSVEAAVAAATTAVVAVTSTGVAHAHGASARLFRRSVGGEAEFFKIPDRVKYSRLRT
ncbi:hypothetical protein [Streptomyces sp. NPDC054783]